MFKLIQTILAISLFFVQTSGAGNFSKEFLDEYKRVSYDMKKLKTRDVECVASNIYHEARGEPFEGQVAVAYVVMNRAEQWNKSICAVVYKKASRIVGKHKYTTCAFTWTCDKSKVSLGRSAYKKYMLLAKLVMVKSLADPTGGALFYHTHEVYPKWHDDHDVIASIGNHVFLL